MNYTYRLTPEIVTGCEQLRIYREAMALVQPDAKLVERLRQQSILRSALYSARIEGNPLSENSRLTGKEKHQVEVRQLAKAYDWVFVRARKALTVQLMLKLHQMVMAGLDESPGVFRREQTAIFNQAGVAVYLTPPPDEIEKRLRDMLLTINNDGGPAPARAGLVHFWFEKIHPFVDGNGRVGRLLMAYGLHHWGYGFEGLLTVERVLEQKRSEYYDLLSYNRQDVTEFVAFMIESLLEASQTMLTRLKQPQQKTTITHLLPRQEEILAIVADHREVSFDFIRRRFLSVPPSTLHYDLRTLIRRGDIFKLGSTRGVRYRVKQTGVRGIVKHV